jgi:hypothetical protein
MDEQRIRSRIKLLIEKANSRVDEAVYGEVVHGAASIMTLVHGPGSKQLAALDRAIADEQRRIAAILLHQDQREIIAKIIAGALAGVLAEIDAGLVGSIRQQAAAEVLADFVALSRSALEDGGGQGKNVASVLAAAAFEDSIRRLGATHAGIIGGEKLADVLEALKKSGFLQGPQVAIAQSYLTFRNHAMHAQWDKIESEAVNSVLGFVEQLVLKYFQ